MEIQAGSAVGHVSFLVVYAKSSAWGGAAPVFVKTQSMRSKASPKKAANYCLYNKKCPILFKITTSSSASGIVSWPDPPTMVVVSANLNGMPSTQNRGIFPDGLPLHLAGFCRAWEIQETGSADSFLKFYTNPLSAAVSPQFFSYCLLEPEFCIILHRSCRVGRPGGPKRIWI